LISLRNCAEPVTLARSPTLTKFARVINEGFEAGDVCGAASRLHGARFTHGIGNRGDGRGAATTDDVEQAGTGEFAEYRRHVRSFVAAKRIRQVGV
jgi:hypothetical protein